MPHHIQVSLFLFISGSALAQEQPTTLAGCAKIVDNTQRLACFDQLAAGSAATRNEQANRSAAQVPASPTSPTAKENARKDDSDASSLAQHWELAPENKRGLFAFRSHQENYVLFANYSTAPNEAPFRPFIDLAPQLQRLSDTEVKFQLGFKIKLMEDISSRHADLWFGYTQQSYWQAYNQDASSPFRDSNYQPELMFVVPTDFRFLGMRARFINLGLVHQSNGQSLPLSRSWNRVYAQAGLENGNFTLLARVWRRLNGTGRDDDNPDITDYMGHGDLIGTYRWKGHEFSLHGRFNFHKGRGAAQAAWAFPLAPTLAPNLKGYIQAFSGYGESLIDYNHFQRTIGLGVLIAF